MNRACRFLKSVPTFVIPLFFAVAELCGVVVGKQGATGPVGDTTKASDTVCMGGRRHEYTSAFYAPASPTPSELGQLGH